MNNKVIEIDFDDEECGSDDVPLSLIKLLKERNRGDDQKIVIRDGNEVHDVTENLDRILQMSSQHAPQGTSQDPTLQRFDSWREELESSGGAFTASYAWKQTSGEVVIWLPLPNRTIAKDLRVGCMSSVSGIWQFELPLHGEHEPRLADSGQVAQSDRNIKPLICNELVVVQKPRSTTKWSDPIITHTFDSNDVLYRGSLTGMVRGEPAERDWEVLRQHVWHGGALQDVIKIELKKAVSASSQAIDLSTPIINEFGLIQWWGNSFSEISRNGDTINLGTESTFGESKRADGSGLVAVSTALGEIDVERIPERLKRKMDHARRFPEGSSTVDVIDAVNAVRGSSTLE
eukprot:GHVH01008223.1.p2 GENE.GHVH01008223.1~~GHVH01008223.1.p2  ORF type:complete len:346 (+),score=44.33 GHVH01008223.1:1335-2372(+)